MNNKDEDYYPRIAKLILSTRKKSNRLLSINEIASEINWLISNLGSINKVSKELKISSGMLNQFLSIDKLDERVQSLVSERRIDSVSVVFSLSKFNKSEQLDLAKLIISKKINSQDLKILRPLRKQYPNLNANDLVDKLLSSKNIKISVIQFYLQDLKKDKISFHSEISRIIGENNICSLNFDSIPCLLKITSEGKQILFKEAKRRNTTLQGLLELLLK